MEYSLPGDGTGKFGGRKCDTRMSEYVATTNTSFAMGKMGGVVRGKTMKEERRRTRRGVAIKVKPNAKREKQPALPACAGCSRVHVAAKIGAVVGRGWAQA